MSASTQLLSRPSLGQNTTTCFSSSTPEASQAVSWQTLKCKVGGSQAGSQVEGSLQLRA